jgi:hypothetical protein
MGVAHIKLTSLNSSLDSKKMLVSALGTWSDRD